MSCGIGANWWVRHEGDAVRIDGVTRFDATHGSSGPEFFSTSDLREVTQFALRKRHLAVEFPEASCVVPILIYAEEVTRLSRSVLTFAAYADKQFVDDFDRSEWLGWQAEVRENLEAFESRLG